MPMYKRAAIWCDTFGYNFSVLRTKLAHRTNCWNCLRPGPIKMMNDKNKLSTMFYLQALIHTASFNFILNVPP